MKPHVLQMAPLMAHVEAALADAYVVHDWRAAADRDALLAEVGAQVRGVATTGGAGIAGSVIDRLPALEIVANYGVGYDAVDLAACKARGVRVTNTPDVLNDAVAEITLGLMIALCRRIPQADAYTRAGKWTGGDFPLTEELTGKRVGILGLGRIGKEIARRAQAFRMEVVYHGRSRQPDQPFPFYASLEAMAADVDWLVVIAPGGAATEGVVSRAVMSALGPQGCLVNVARGGLVDQPAMIEMLRSGALCGAALDVFHDEPNADPALFALDNVVLSPHQGSATHKTRRAMGDLVVRNLAAHFAGAPLPTPVA